MRYSLELRCIVDTIEAKPTISDFVSDISVLSSFYNNVKVLVRVSWHAKQILVTYRKDTTGCNRLPIFRSSNELALKLVVKELINLWSCDARTVDHRNEYELNVLNVRSIQPTVQVKDNLYPVTTRSGAGI